MRSHASLRFPVPTIKPQAEVIKAIYCEDFTQAERNLFINECKIILKKDAIAARVSPGGGHQDIFIYHVGVSLHARWLELGKIEEGFTLETSEDFFILQYLLSQRHALTELNLKFNLAVIARAKAELVAQTMPANPPAKVAHSFLNFLKNIAKKIIETVYAKPLVDNLIIVSCVLAGLLSGVMSGLKFAAILTPVFPGVVTVIAVVGGILGTGLGSWLSDKLVGLTTSVVRFYRHLHLSEEENKKQSELAPLDTSRIHLMLSDANLNKKRAGLRRVNKADKAKPDYENLLQAIAENPRVNKFGVYFTSGNNSLLIWSKHDNWLPCPACDSAVMNTLPQPKF